MSGTCPALVVESKGYVKTVKLTSRGQAIFRHITYEFTHSIGHVGEKAVDFVFGAFNDQLNASVREIPHEPRHLVSASDPMGRESKPDSLNMARVVHLPALQG
jgi:hypothetical protein